MLLGRRVLPLEQAAVHKEPKQFAPEAYCSYNDHMARNATVGSRELKTRLGRYLGRVRRGETLVITDRNEPIAELRPLDIGADPTTRRLRKLAAEGTVTLASRASLDPLVPVRTHGRSASAAVSADRDDRG